MSAALQSPPAPTWASGDRRLSHTVGRGFRALAELFRRYVVYRGNKVAYLRALGARIGRDTAILNEVQGFGTEPWLVEIGDRLLGREGRLIAAVKAIGRGSDYAGEAPFAIEW